MPAPKKNPATRMGRLVPLEKAEVRAVKAGAKAAKNPMTMNKTARGSSQMSAEYNAGYIAGKKDIAAFKRNQAKQTMKKMGKKK